MKNRKPKIEDFKWKKADAAAAAAVIFIGLGILAGFAFYGRGKTSVTAVVYQDGEVIREVDLTEDQNFEIGGSYHNTVTVKDGKICVTHTDCPGGDCAHSGWKSRAGESIVCLPNRMEIRLQGKGKDADGVDFVTGN